MRYTIDTPLIDPNSALAIGWKYYGDFCNLIFILELVLNLLRYGFIVGNGSYLRRHWYNVVSFVVVLMGALSYIPARGGWAYSMLDKFKILKVLSFVQIQEDRDKNMRVALRAIAKLGPKIFKLFILMLIFFGFFAIILTKIYKSSASKCWNTP